MNVQQQSAEARLSDKYIAYCDAAGFPAMSCDELITQGALGDLPMTDDQLKWLSDFYMEWCIEVDGDNPDNVFNYYEAYRNRPAR